MVDINDRFLREIEVGLGKDEAGHEHRSGYDITVATEIMAILALTTDLRRHARTPRAHGRRHQPARRSRHRRRPRRGRRADRPDEGRHQTEPDADPRRHARLRPCRDRSPTSPTDSPPSSPTRSRSSWRDYVITESGFGADIGMEKFFDIKCRYSGLIPQVVVLVATVRALKMHGGGPKVVAGKPLAPEYTDENLDLLQQGLAQHGTQHIQNALKFGVNVVVAVNSFANRHPRRSGTGPQGRARSGRHGRGRIAPLDGRRQGRDSNWPKRSSKPAEKPSNFKFLYPLEHADQGKDRDHRTRDLSRRRRGLHPRSRSQDRAVTPASALTTCRSAWRRPTSPSPTDADQKGAPTRLPRDRCATSAPAWARASSIRCSATCAPCPACPPAPSSTMWTSTSKTGKVARLVLTTICAGSEALCNQIRKLPSGKILKGVFRLSAAERIEYLSKLFLFCKPGPAI
ncbi:MAG: formate--tetrahydrofolate ligase [Bacillus subtilis]|nr:formate--tetrahydrofolate ligase [Bacillus subtilis]